MERWDQLKISMADWYRLKDALECADASQPFSVAPNLEEHEVTKLLRQYQSTGERRYLDKASRRLTGAGSQSWVALWKS